jgi:SAM-dependent methyltransferase
MPEIGLPKQEGYYTNVRREIASLLHEDIGTVLEIGCGEGGTMEWIKRNYRVTFAAGVELDAEAGSVARNIFDSVEIGHVDEVPLKFAVQSFDMILCLDVLEHLPRPDRTLERICRLLRPGGIFVTSLPNVANHTVAVPLLFRGEWNYQDEGQLDRTHLRFFTGNTAVKLLQEANLKIEQVETTFNYPNLFSCLGWIGPAPRWYSRRLLEIFPVIPKRLLISQYMIRACKCL